MLIMMMIDDDGDGESYDNADYADGENDGDEGSDMW